MSEDSEQDNKGKEAPIAFKLSEAPIHRIQTLATVFHKSLLHIEGFRNTEGAVFARRDFDSPYGENEKIVFNATFYRPDVVDKFKVVQPADLSLDRLPALRDTGLNSKQTERHALDRSVEKIQNWSQEQSAPTLEQRTNGWLELYSRAAYKGGLPGFIADAYSTKDNKLPSILLCEARLDEGGSGENQDKYYDTIWESSDEKSESGDQPPLELIPIGNDKENPGTKLYNELQRQIDPSYEAQQKVGTKRYIYMLPVYDYFHVQEKTDEVIAWGALLGFLFLPIEGSKNSKTEDFKTAKKTLPQVAPHLNRFAWGFLRAEFNEILNEDYSGDDPLQFIELHAGRVDGWKFSIPEQAPSELVEISGDSSDLSISIDLRLDLFSNEKVPPAIKLEKKDSWTRWTRCENIEAEKEASLNIARRIRHFYEQATLQHAKKMSGKRSGALASAHDYSKQVGSAGKRLYDFNERLEKVSESIRKNAEQLEQPGTSEEVRSISRQIKQTFEGLHVSRLEWFDVIQFNLNHLHAQTQSAQPMAHTSPTACMSFIEKGRKRDIYALINRLVWLPLDYEGYKEIEKETNGRALDQLEDPLTWATLFQFDTGAPPDSKFHQNLAKRISTLILKEKMTQTQFWDAFPVPVINPNAGMDDNLLWNEWLNRLDEKPLPPVIGLLPLMVFSLRFAYQCAWSKTLLQGTGEPEVIQIIAGLASARNYEIKLIFNSPVPYTEDPSAIPYFNEWRRQMRHYRGGKSFPWQVTETVTVLPDDEIELTLNTKQ